MKHHVTEFTIRNIVVTQLCPGLIMLIRYAIGDLVVPYAQVSFPLLAGRSVDGLDPGLRCR